MRGIALGYDGVIRVQKLVDGDAFAKSLKEMSQELDRQVAKMEKRLEDLRKKREQALNAASVKNSALDAEQAKLQALQKEWQQWNAVAGNTSLAGRVREQAAAEIAQLTAKLETQRASVKALQEEFGRAAGSVEKYDAEICTVAAELEEQRSAAQQCAEELAGVQEGLLQIGKSAEIGDQHIVELSHTLAELKQRQEVLENAGVGLGFQEYDENLWQIQSITAELKAYQNALKASASGGEADRLLESLQEMGEKLAGSFAVPQDIQGWFGELSGLKEGLQEAAEAVGDAWEAALATVRKNAARAAHALAKAARVGAEAVDRAAAAVKAAVPVVKQLSGIDRITGALAARLERLGTVLRQSFLDVPVGNAVALLRHEMDAYLAVDQQFVGALNRIRGVLLTAFQPVYEAALPALTALVNLLADAVAVVSHFTAALFGTTTKKAQKNAQALYQQAHALDAVGSAAKRAEVALAPFDDFHILDFHESGGSGGGAAASLPDFTYDYDAVQFDSWGEAFSNFLDRLLDGIPKLENAFQRFADWVNGFSKKLYDMFTFPGVLEKVERLGKELAGAFHKLVEWINWKQLGQALGAGMNLALQFLTELIYGFDWVSLGRKFAEFVNGLAAEVDWFDFGRLLWAGFKISLETLAGFIAGLDMPLLAEAASNTILGFFQEMLNTVQSIPWTQIGSQIAVFWNSIKWYDLITSAFAAAAAAFTALFDMLRAFVETLQWHEIAVQVYSAVNASMGKIDWFAIGQTLGDAFIQAVCFLRDVIAGIDWYQLGVDVGRFLIGIDWVGALGGLAQAVAAGLGAAILAARGLLDTIAPDIQEIARGIAEKINDFFRSVDWAGAGRVLSDGLELALDFAIAFLQSVDWNAIGTAIVTLLENIDWPSLLTKWGELVGEAMTAALAVIHLDGIIDVGRNIVEGLLQGILDRIASVGGWLKENFVDPVVNGVKELFGIHSPSTVFAEIGQNLVAGLLLGLSETWNGITEFFHTKLEDILSVVSSAWDHIKCVTSSSWEEIKNFTGAVWTSLKENAGVVFAAIRETVTNAWSAAAADSAAKWDEIRNGISEKILSLKDFVTEGFSNIKAVMTGKITEAVEELKGKDWASVGYRIVDGVLAGLKSIFHKLSGWASEVWGSITGAFSSSQTRASSGNKRSGTAFRLAGMPEIQTVELPKLANGAVIPPNQQFAAILGDQRGGVNIEAPLATIEKALENVLNRGGFGGDIHITVESVLDGKVLARNTVRHINDMTASAGKPVLLF